MIPEFPSVYGVILQTIVMGIGYFLVHRASMKSLKASPYDAISTRVKDLEARISTVEQDNYRLKDDNEMLKRDNVKLKRDGLDDRALIQKLIELVTQSGIHVPPSWYPTWWRQEEE